MCRVPRHNPRLNAPTLILPPIKELYFLDLSSHLEMSSTKDLMLRDEHVNLLGKSNEISLKRTAHSCVQDDAFIWLKFQRSSSVS
jgi:hypothetical protein